jgi:PAS domain-containing protein
VGRLDVLARQGADLIERGKAEAALHESNDQLLWLVSIVENSDDAIITKNLDGIISSWNKSAERIFGAPELQRALSLQSPRRSGGMRIVTGLPIHARRVLFNLKGAKLANKPITGAALSERLSEFGD